MVADTVVDAVVHRRPGPSSDSALGGGPGFSGGAVAPLVRPIAGRVVQEFRDRAVDVAMPATAYDVPAGHALALVVDTVDPLYFDENAPNGEITMAGGSYLDVPVR